MKEFLESRFAILLMLYVGLLIFSAAVIVAALCAPANERLYVFLTGIAGNFGGALLTAITIKPNRPGIEARNE